MTGLRGRKVLVTGGTGFIGGRVVEKLILEEGAEVRALVSRYPGCARLARFPVELRLADLLDRESVVRAAEGCDIIFHCAYGSRGTAEERRRVTIEGTDNLVAAAAAHGSHLVHLSTQMVYGLPQSGDLDEGAPRQRTGRTYGDSKLEAEERVLRAAGDGLKATVLQPTAVYGPWAPVWTVGVLERMRAGRVPLIDGGEGTCNAVYVDDVVTAMLLAAESEAALGEALLISAAEPVSWREFYGRYEAMLGVPATVPVSVDEAGKSSAPRPRSLLQELPAVMLREPAVRQRLLATIEGRLLSRVLRPLLPRRQATTATPELDKLKRIRRAEEPSAKPIAAADVAFFAARARVRIDKARRLLGYRPAFDLDRGMDLTGAWARWAGLVPESEEHRAVAAVGS